MKDQTKAIKRFIIIVAAGIYVVSIAFYLLLLQYPNTSALIKEHIAADFANTELANALVVFAIALPIGLAALLACASVYCIRSYREYKNLGIKRLKKKKPVKKGKIVRFPALSALDKKLEKHANARFDTVDTLEKLCVDFQRYAACEHKLYYDIKDVRRFIGGMGISRLILLRGMSGTGKTSLAYVAGEYFANPSTVVPIQPMWKERSDMIGYFNEFTKKFNETTMLCKLYEAGGRQDVFITVLDEVNIARIEYYFAEFLSLLELPEHRRYLDVVSDSWGRDPKRLKGGKLLLPPNMWFVGTANNDDSTFAISDKVYDRAAVLDLDKKCSPFVCKPSTACHISYAELTRLFNNARSKYRLSEGARYALISLDEYLNQAFRIAIGNRMMGQIERYVPIMLACGATEEEALDDMICRKILRKLEQINPAYVRSMLDDLTACMDRIFGAETLPLSKEYINKLSKGF
ncbi:MAG: hypothetical protein IKK58_06310 [Clostridia bacterium]|nr:hypothetical protein [Clostridia bacterium]